MKRTLLDLTQSILSSLNSDEVNSISDTTESMQVAEVIKTTYFNIISRTRMTKHSQLVQLDSSQDNDRPVLMYIPSGVGKIDYIKYFNSNVNDVPNNNQHDINVDIVTTSSGNANIVPGYQYVTILPVREFIDMVNSFNPSESDVESFTFSDSSNNFPSSYTFYYKTLKQPSYCTVLSNYYVIFDGFDSAVDDTLQSSKTMCSGEVIPVFNLVDTFIPDLEEEQFPLLLNEAKSLAFFELKQTPHQKAEQEARRGWSALQKTKSVVDKPSYFNQLPDFGRSGGTWRTHYRGNPITGN